MSYPGVIEIQGVQINDIEIGKIALCQYPPVVQAVKPRRIRALATYRMFDGDAARALSRQCCRRKVVAASQMVPQWAPPPSELMQSPDASTGSKKSRLPSV